MHNKRRILWLIPPILVGIAVLFMLTGNRQLPVRVEAEEPARIVRTIEVRLLDVNPVAEGYGVVQPARVWTAVAQVAGRVVEMHPRLRDGEILQAGTQLFRIDPVDYELALAQFQAELAELDVQEQNTADLLAIEQRNLELARREAQRLTDLAAKGTTSRSNADDAERAMLASRTAVQNLQNTLALLPSRRRVIEAQVEQARRDLENSIVKAPFDLRVAALDMEVDQYVTTGQKLFEGDSVDRSEVVAQVAISSLRNLFLGRGDQAPDPALLAENLAAYADMQVTLEMDVGSHTARWDAEFVRFTDRVDSETRTIGAVVALDKPFAKVIPGRRPPLSKGMFVKVRLVGRQQPQQLVVPRNAVRNGRVMLVDEQQRLAIVPITTLYSQDEISVIESGIEAGQQLVVTDLVPAVVGMRLQAQRDEALERELLDTAGGRR
jgi:RND family efflux transporter MFP subunit